MKKILIFLIVFLSLSILPPCLSINEIDYELQIKVTIEGIPLQFASQKVNFEIVNLGDKTFSGILTLDVEGEDASYVMKEFQISSLQKGKSYANSSSYAIDDEGRYWFTFEIYSNDFGRIRLYLDSTPQDEANRVRHACSKYMFPFYLTVTLVVAIVGSIVIPIVLINRRKSHARRPFRK